MYRKLFELLLLLASEAGLVLDFGHDCSKLTFLPLNCLRKLGLTSIQFGHGLLANPQITLYFPARLFQLSASLKCLKLTNFG